MRHMRWGRKAGALPFSAVFFSSPARAPLFSKHCGCDSVAWPLAIRSGCSADSLQFYGGSGVGKRTGWIIENPAMAAAAFLRCAGALRRILWLHDCFWPSRRWRFAAARLADAVELSAGAARAAVRGFLSDFACAYNSDGFDAAGRH